MQQYGGFTNLDLPFSVMAVTNELL